MCCSTVYGVRPRPLRSCRPGTRCCAVSVQHAGRVVFDAKALSVIVPDSKRADRVPVCNAAWLFKVRRRTDWTKACLLLARRLAPAQTKIGTSSSVHRRGFSPRPLHLDVCDFTRLSATGPTQCRACKQSTSRAGGSGRRQGRRKPTLCPSFGLLSSLHFNRRLAFSAELSDEQEL